MYVSLILVSLCMVILLMYVTTCLRCSLISSREHPRPGDFITSFKKFCLGEGMFLCLV